jgi:hypothetical protein
LTPAQLVTMLDRVYDEYHAGGIFNLVLTNICDQTGTLYEAQLDAVRPYLPGGGKQACDNVFVGTTWKIWEPAKYGADLTQWWNHYAVWGGTLNERYRWDQINLSVKAWKAFKARYGLPWMHFYLSNEGDLQAFGHPTLGPSIRAATEAFLVELCRQAKAIEPARSILWSPFCWTPYTQIAEMEKTIIRRGMTDIFSAVETHTGMGINFLDVQDGVGARSGVTKPQDAALLFKDVKAAYGFSSLRMNVEQFAITTQGFVSVDTTAREQWYSEQGISPGACWELRYWNPTPTVPPTPTTVEYLTRSQWGARTDLPRLGYFVPANRRTELHIHHAASVDGNDATPNRWSRTEAVGYMRRLQTARPDLGLDIPYNRVHFVLEDLSVLICEGRGEMRTGAHTAGHNTAGFGWSVGGNFDVADHKAHEAFLTVVENEARYLRGNGFPNLCSVKSPRGWDMWGHRDTAPKSCPGNTLYWNLAPLEVAP